MKIEISTKVKKNIERLFSMPEANFVLEELANIELALTKEYERIFMAILKLSEGNIDKFIVAYELAEQDWRDVLVGAGFGNEDWKEKIDEYFI